MLEFNFKKKQPEVKPTLLPTLPNLYGLDVRFRYIEKKMKEERDRRSIKRNSMASTAGAQLQVGDGPANRHGSVGRAHQIGVTTYKQ